MSNFFRSTYSKTIGVIAVLAIVIGIPLVILNVKSQQTLQQSASVFGNNGHDSCNKTTIAISENPVCENINPPQKNNVGSYTVTLNVISNDNKSHTVSYTDQSDFCTGGYLSNGCSDNAIHNSNTKTTPFTVKIQRSPTIGAYCGSYQTDFRITAVDNNNSCTYNTNSAGASGQCETGTTCKPTPTPTSKPTNTPTPKQTTTPTPTRIPSTTPTNTPIPSITNTPTPTVCTAPGIVANVRVSCSINCTNQ